MIAVPFVKNGERYWISG